MLAGGLAGAGVFVIVAAVAYTKMKRAGVAAFRQRNKGFGFSHKQNEPLMGVADQPPPSSSGEWQGGTF